MTSRTCCPRLRSAAPPSVACVAIFAKYLGVNCCDFCPCSAKEINEVVLCGKRAVIMSYNLFAVEFFVVAKRIYFCAASKVRDDSEPSCFQEPFGRVGSLRNTVGP